MALIPSTSFSNDITGNLTSIVPIVFIKGRSSNIYISTNSLTFDNIEYKPLLLNISAIKESIDLDKKRYKIGNCSLDISNNVYQGSRFHEIVSDSLINAKVYIYWITPTVTVIDDALLALNGQVVKYDMSEDKVRLTIEDRSQATLHRDIPTTRLPSATATPERSRQSVVPMVYGNVNKSPCIISSTMDPSSGDGIVLVDSTENIKEIQIDKPYNEADLYNQSGIYCYDSIYGEVTRLDKNGNKQWEISNNKIIFPRHVIEGHLSRTDLNIINIKYLALPTSLSTRPAPLSETNLTIPDVYGAISGRTNLMDSSVNNYLQYSAVTLFGGSTSQTNVGTYPEFSLLYTNHFGLTLYRESISHGLLINAQLLTPSTYNPSTTVGYNVELTADKAGSNEADIVIDLFEDIGNQISGIFNNATGVTIPFPSGFDFGNTGGTFTHSEDEPISFGTDLTRPISSLTILITGSPGGSAGNNDVIQINLRLSALAWLIEAEYEYKKFDDLKFYADVSGRIMDEETWGEGSSLGLIHKYEDIVKDIAMRELHLDRDIIDTTGSSNTYSNWNYDFTIDRSVNSKKLLENLASVSPYLFRFNALGDFRINTILKDYNGASSKTIKKSRVLNFTYKQTDIASVYTKITFLYHWDYALGEYTKSVTLPLIDNLDNVGEADGYLYSYYGFDPEDAENERTKDYVSDSTYVISDDRGKFIRDDDVARLFAQWYLLWHCNTHLIITAKLSLYHLTLEVGDLINFERLSDVDPYNIDYTVNKKINGQTRYKHFMVTSTSKNLDGVTIEATQMHNLSGIEISGCTDENACNYDSTATVMETDSCYYNPDCMGICGGDSVLDGCGVCTGIDEYQEGSCHDDCGNHWGECEENVQNPSQSSFGDPNCDCILCDGQVGHLVGELWDENGYDCNNDCGGSASIDECGICSGGYTELTPNASCSDCFGVPNGDGRTNPCEPYECVSQAYCDEQGNPEMCCNDADEDGICDCNDGCVGELDDCGVCSGLETGHVANSDKDDCGDCWGGNAAMDCFGVCDGDGIYDNCGDCRHGGSDENWNVECADCLGEPNGESQTDCAGECFYEGEDHAVVDQCGECGGDGQPYGANYDCDGNCMWPLDCNGDCLEPDYQAIVDECGVCGGDGASYECGCSDTGCHDNCGVPYGNNATCTECNDQNAFNYTSNSLVNSGCLYADESDLCPFDELNGEPTEDYICNDLPHRCLDNVIFQSGQRGAWLVAIDEVIPTIEIGDYCSANPGYCTTNHQFYPLILRESECNLLDLGEFYLGLDCIKLTFQRGEELSGGWYQQLFNRSWCGDTTSNSGTVWSHPPATSWVEYSGTKIDISFTGHTSHENASNYNINITITNLNNNVEIFNHLIQADSLASTTGIGTHDIPFTNDFDLGSESDSSVLYRITISATCTFEDYDITLFNKEKYLTLNYSADTYHCQPEPGDLLCNYFNEGQSGYTGCIGDPELSALDACINSGDGICNPGASFCLCAGNMNNDVIIDPFDLLVLDICLMQGSCGDVPVCGDDGGGDGGGFDP